MSARTWSDAEIELAAGLWKEGKSAAEIARRLRGHTRSAVLGKLRRIGLLAGREQAAAPPRAPACARSEPSAPAPAPPAPATPAPAVVPYPLGRPFLDRRRKECAWPLAGEGETLLFCGAPTERTYCAEHAAVAYTKRPDAKDLIRDLRRYA